MDTQLQGKKLEAVRVATQYQFPVGDIEQVLAEIEAGYVPSLTTLPEPKSSQAT